MNHRVFGVIAAVLFGLFVVGGAITLLNSLPRHSCSGVAPTNYSGDTVQLAGSGWPSIPANHCVEVISVQVAQANKLTVGNGYDLGPAPGIHTGTAWNYARLGIGAWIAWTLAMVMLALAVAALPGRSGSKLPTPIEGYDGYYPPWPSPSPAAFSPNAVLTPGPIAPPPSPPPLQ